MVESGSGAQEPEFKEVVIHRKKRKKGKREEDLKDIRLKDLLRGIISTPSLETAIINGKYVNSIPLYRMEQEFKRNDVNQNRQDIAH